MRDWSAPLIEAQCALRKVNELANEGDLVTASIEALRAVHAAAEVLVRLEDEQRG